MLGAPAALQRGADEAVVGKEVRQAVGVQLAQALGGPAEDAAEGGPRQIAHVGRFTRGARQVADQAQQALARDVRVGPERLDDRKKAAVRLVAAGDALLSPGVTRRLIAEFARMGAPRSPSREHLKELTDRESEVLALVARGMSNAEIAGYLVVAEQTVKTHVSRILMKLGLRDRTQAVVLAYETGLVHPGG